VAGIRPEMKDHPLMLAARYNDARAEEVGVEAVLEQMGLALADVVYLAEQRALRVVAVFSTRPEMKRLLVNTNRPMAVPRMHDHERRVFQIAQTAYLDAIAIGYKAREIATRAKEEQ